VADKKELAYAGTNLIRAGKSKLHFSRKRPDSGLLSRRDGGQHPSQSTGSSHLKMATCSRPAAFTKSTSSTTRSPAHSVRIAELFGLDLLTLYFDRVESDFH
jgi:hypothetical protein